MVRIEGLSDIAMSLNGMQGEVQVLVKNPNGFDIRAQEVDVNMYVGEDRIATVTLPGVQVLEARSESMLGHECPIGSRSIEKITPKPAAPADWRKFCRIPNCWHCARKGLWLEHRHSH